MEDISDTESTTSSLPASPSTYDLDPTRYISTPFNDPTLRTLDTTSSLLYYTPNLHHPGFPTKSRPIKIRASPVALRTLPAELRENIFSYCLQRNVYYEDGILNEARRYDYIDVGVLEGLRPDGILYAEALKVFWKSQVLKLSPMNQDSVFELSPTTLEFVERFYLKFNYSVRQHTNFKWTIANPLSHLRHLTSIRHLTIEVTTGDPLFFSALHRFLLRSSRLESLTLLIDKAYEVEGAEKYLQEMIENTSMWLLNLDDWKGKTGFKCAFDYRLLHQFPHSQWGRERKTKENQAMNQHLCRWVKGPVKESQLGFAPCNPGRIGELGELLGAGFGAEEEALTR